MGFIAEFLRFYRLIGITRRHELEKQKDFAPLGNHFEAMFSNNIYRKASDVLSRPLCCVPSTDIVIRERDFDGEWDLKLTGNRQKAINMGQVNYFKNI